MARDRLLPIGPLKRMPRLDATQRANLYTVLRNDAMRRGKDDPLPLVGLAPVEHVAPFNTARVVAWAAWLVLFAALAGPWLAQKMS